jgi:hypothetical protein
MTGLPAGLVDLLDGSDLERKIGHTLLILAAGEDGWPHAATVSVGELLAVTSRELLLTLYAGSRTTAALAFSRRALLMTTAEGGVVKVALDVRPLTAEDSDQHRRVFHCTVASARVDTVPYARVTHGIGFQLVDEGAALTRWKKQIEHLKELAGAI